MALAKAPSSTPPSADGVRRINGKRASAGFVIGPVHRFTAATAMVDGDPSGTPEEERARLTDAMEAAMAQLADIVEAADDAASAEILSFQIALLEDEELAAPALNAIAGGQGAVAAWTTALDAQIDDYRHSEDDYFQARAEDLTDLRDRVLSVLATGDSQTEGVPPGAIVLTDALAPSAFLAIDWTTTAGLALAQGSASSHVAMLARARVVPMVVGLGSGADALADGATIVLNADDGVLLHDLGSAELDAARSEAERRAEAARAAALLLPRPAITAGGTPVTVCINVDTPALLEAIPASHCDGIGLTRTEFLFDPSRPLPDEDRQYQVYRQIIDWADGRPVTIRTLDAGGDKPIPGVTFDGEANPFLGVRGLRLSLVRPDVFSVQLRALARASAHGALKVMFPMVTAPAEFAQARHLMTAALADVAAAGQATGTPEIGMMVEVPAAAVAIDRFDADFFSIGSNDLIQYVTAVSRDNGTLAALYDPLHPAVLDLIARVAAHGRAVGRDVSVCGDMGAEPATLSALLDCGIRSVSVAPAALAGAKATIADYREIAAT